MASGFPAIVPGAGVDVETGFADGGGGCEEVGCGGEVFIGEGEDAGAEDGGGEVGGCGEGCVY